MKGFLANKSFRWKIMVCVISALVVMCISLFLLLNIDLRAMNVIEDTYVSNAELNSYLETIREAEQSLEDYVEYRTFESIDTYYTYRARIIEYRSQLHSNPSTDVFKISIVFITMSSFLNGFAFLCCLNTNFINII